MGVGLALKGNKTVKKQKNIEIRVFNVRWVKTFLDWVFSLTDFPPFNKKIRDVRKTKTRYGVAFFWCQAKGGIVFLVPMKPLVPCPLPLALAPCPLPLVGSHWVFGLLTLDV